MNIREEILQELKEIAPILAAIEKKDPFRVPEGYFGVNEEAMLKGSTDQEIELPAVLRFASGVNPYRIPENYFQDSTDALMHAVSSKQDYIPQVLADLDKKEVFSVPETYFADNKEALLAAVSQKEESLPAFLVAARSTDPFKMPDNYFEQLEGRVMERIRTEETSDLDVLKEDQPFQVPAAYFEELPGKVMQRIREESGAKVIPIEKPSIIRRILPYVSTVAAVLLMTIGITLFYPGTDTGIGPDVVAVTDANWQEQLASLTDDEINSALTKSIDDLDEYYLLDNVGEYDIFTFSKLGDDFLNDYLLDEIDEDLLRELI